MSQVVLELNDQIEIGERAWKLIPKPIKKDAKNLAKQYELRMDHWEIGRAIGLLGGIIADMEDEVKSSKDNVSGIRDLNERDKVHLFSDKMRSLVDIINYKNLSLHMNNVIFLTMLLADRALNLDKS